MNKYSNFLQKKKIVLIGPSNYLNNFNYGFFFDTFDIIVRLNRGIELIENNESKLGSRTDILYNCLVKSPYAGGSLDSNFYYRKGVKWISTIPISDFNGKKISYNLLKNINVFNLLPLMSKFNFHIMNKKLLRQFQDPLNFRLNTGIAAIIDILSFDISELYISGFSFYLDNFFDEYKKGTLEKNETLSKKSFFSKRHQQMPQLNLIKDLFQKDSRLKIDPVLNEIFKKNVKTRSEFKLLMEHRFNVTH